jgi:2,4-dienoyl-CoA reductase (NADPH2)
LLEHNGARLLFEYGLKIMEYERTSDGKRHKVAPKAPVRCPDIDHIFLTHCHIDHYGLASWLEVHSNAAIYIPRVDLVRFQRHREHLAKAGELMKSYGFGFLFLQTVRQSYLRTTIPPRDISRYRVVEDSPELEAMGIGWIACPGHSQSDLAYLVGDEAVTGDILLKGIFQVPLLDIDIMTFEGRFRNYDTWCTSIASIASLRGRRILPGHRRDVDLDASLTEYVGILLARAVKVRRFQHLPLPEVISELFKGRLREPFHVYIKASEIVFMMDFLENPGLLRAALEGAGLFAGLAEVWEGALGT